MERQRNHLQFVKTEADLLPIEEEFLASVKSEVESAIGSPISYWKKHKVHSLYDCYLIVSDNKPYFLKVNLSPDMPNFWQELNDNNFNFHPKIVSFSKEASEYKFICFEVPKGAFLSDLSKYPLSPKLNLQKTFAQALSEMHSIKIGSADNTVDIFNSFLPREAIMVFKTYPVANLFSTCKIVFKQLYKPNTEHCGLCHFDLTGENIIYTGTNIKFINFEYAANANTYLDIWLAKQTLNCSDQVFESFVDLMPKAKGYELRSYEEVSHLFNFAYFNSKIVSEYMTFGLRDPIKLKFWLNKSEESYNRIFGKLFVDKPLDKLIRDFYYLWK